MSATEAEERAQFTLRMRARGIHDIDLLRALERAPRALFMPQRYADIAARDLALPIGGGQTSPPPSVVAAMIAALSIRRSDRALEIGTGTGYSTALLAQLSGEVVTLERRQILALEAAARLKAFGLTNVVALWRDGLAEDAVESRFERVLANGLVEDPRALFEQLVADGGVLVAPMAVDTRGEQTIVRFERDRAGALRAVPLGHARAFTPLSPSLSRAA